MTDGNSDKTYDPRVTLHNVETGEATPVEADLVQGLDEFSKAWEPQVEAPSSLMFEAWQMSDDQHPPRGRSSCVPASSQDAADDRRTSGEAGNAQPSRQIH
jgi:hypothetical protein